MLPNDRVVNFNSVDDRADVAIARIAQAGVAILLVEQEHSIAMRTSNRVNIMGHGRVVFEGTPNQLKSNFAVGQEWLEV
jgi:branched-chain amino acid transport system ATP-binding protein